MASFTHSDFVSLAEEKFDFDVTLSPSRFVFNNVEDEVFIGPVSHKEKCISHGVEDHMKDCLSSGQSLGEEPSWSPLTGEKFEEICKEALLLASHLEQTITDSVVENSVVSSSQAEDTETFEEDLSTKVSLFSKPSYVLSPIKRETFLVQDSPMKQLPPAFQKRMLKAGGPAGFGKPRLSTSSPLRPAMTQSKMSSRNKALVASNGVLPSKPMAHSSSRLSSSTKLPSANKTRLPPPSKGNLGLKRSPVCRNTSRAGSSEDLLSDTTSVASDVSDSSLNTSLPGKSSIPTRTKNKEMYNMFSITMAVNAQLNSSLNSSVNSINGCSHSRVSRLPSSGRKSSVVTRNPEPPISRRTSISTQGRRGSELLPRPVKATPIKKVDPVPPPQLQTPAKVTLEKTTSTASAAKLGNALKGNPKLKAPVVPTPINYLKGVRRSEASSSPDVPRVMKPKKLLSACSLESVPDNLAVPAPVGLQTPSAVGSKLRRPSALPTPANRRISGIPALTPQSVSRLSKPTKNTLVPSALGQGATHLSPCYTKKSENQDDKAAPESAEEMCPPADLLPCSLLFSLEDETEDPPACEPAVVENSSEPSLCDPKPSLCDPEPSSSDPEPSSCDPEPPQIRMESPTLPNTKEIKDDHQPMTEKEYLKEVLLVDAPAPVLGPKEKLLIDLSNTPDLLKTSTTKPWGGQLIDLSSPLIKWSPEDKENTENESPLIDFSELSF
ncbi:G2 and S phase-expressed protein 1 [Triplophysa tibetana]|uniref:G2 and S phase-expressed protein 1 n=1 Tax=Triplophysa tibetana TaxID=1572043 RepID=A0A5A9PV19_9TELE|nr:G2 and S phase-expressed protein 1 [Triplophysa tibetana]